MQPHGDERAAHLALSDVYAVAGWTLIKADSPIGAWIAAERAIQASEQVGDVLRLAAATRCLAEVHMRANNLEEATRTAWTALSCANLSDRVWSAHGQRNGADDETQEGEEQARHDPSCWPSHLRSGVRATGERSLSETRTAHAKPPSRVLHGSVREIIGGGGPVRWEVERHGHAASGGSAWARR